MNKKSYRIVFNAARNQHVAVAETGQSDHGGPGFSGGGQPCGSRPHTAVVQTLSFAIWVALGMVSWAPVAQAQTDRGRIVADHSAPSNNQPTILVSPNGTPVVNIQTPSAGGVSRNVYTQFDVGTQGAVLNNSRTGQRTQIGGAVGGNPSLARGTAKVILNEVNSPAASQLRGTIEVSGDRAQVVIANPSGVSCDGCGFINANRVTITTGTPVMNGGSLENYRVEQGTVTIGAGGMNASGADYTDVISRATVINGKIYAKDLKIILGANEVSADGSRVTPIEGKGERPTVSIDSSQLGGMYTNKIIVVSTESGVGVKNSGQIGAAAGDVRISAEGQIINTGSIQSAGHTFVSGQSVVQSGSIYSQGTTQVRGRKIEVQGGLISAKGQTTLEGQSILIGNEGTLAGGMQADGSLASDGRLSLTGQDIRSQGKHFAAGDIEINGSASVNLNDSVSQTQMTMKIAGTASLSTERAKLVAGNFLLAAFVMSNRGGQFYQTGSGGSVFRVRGLDNTEGTILTRGDTTLDLGKLNNTHGLLGVTEGSLELQTQHLINRGGSIEADGNLRIRSGGVLDNTEGRVSSTKTLEITDSAQQRTLSLINTQGTVVGLQGLAVQAARSSGDGQLLSEGALQLSLQSDLHHTGRIIGKLASLDIQGVFTNLGSVQAEELSIHSQSLKNQAGAELLANQAHIEAGAFNNQGLMDVGQLRIDANETTNSGRIYGNEVSLGGGTLTNERGGVVAARVQLDVGMQQVHNQGDITSQGSMRIGGAIDADGHAIGQTQLLRNSSGLIEAADQLSIAAVQTVNERTHFTTQERQTVQEIFLEPLQSDEGDVLHRAVRVETTQTEVTQDSGAGVIRANHLVIKGAIDNDKSLILGVDVQYDPTLYREIGAQRHKSQHTVNTTNGHVTSEHSESSTFEILNTRPLISANETLLCTNKDPAPVTVGSSSPTAPPAAPPAAPGAAAPVGDMTPAAVSFEIPQSKQFEVSLQGPSLVKSDERFSGYREWLASSAQLEALGVDAAGLPKRLGDGYYEQRLLREQVNHLTGHQYLAGDFSAEGEYRTLLDAGVEAARELGLQVGKSLTAEQVKALKKDIVWLETREMTLASGDKVQALVPQLYARVNANDAKADPSKGAGLASGRVITIDMSGEFTQKGNYSATDHINIKADDLKLQGQMLSRDINLQATQDVVNEGAQVMAARQLVVVVAGRDILASSTVGATATGTEITRLAAWGSGNQEAGQLIMQAGRDIRLDGSLVQNASKDITSLVAGQDIVLGTVSVTDKVTRVDGPNRRTTQVTQDVGSQVLGLGDLHLDAGRDLVTKAATIRSTEGLVQGVAGRDIQLQAGVQTTAVDETTVTTKRRWFKKVTTVTHTQTEETLALGSSLSGVDVQLQAGGSIHATGAQVVAQRQANLVAAQDIVLEAARGQSWRHVESHRKTKGLFSSGSLSLTLGTKREDTRLDSVAVQHMGTHVASLNGDVGIQAGRDFKLEGSQVLAPKGLVQIAAQGIQIIDSRNTLTAVQDASVRSSGLTVGVSSPWLGALQTIDQIHTAGTNTNDARMLALAGLAAGMNVYNAANANNSWTVNATLGRSEQRSHMQQSVQSGAGSTVAGKNIVLRAVWDPSHPEDFRPSEGRDITIRGSQVRASEGTYSPPH